MQTKGKFKELYGKDIGVLLENILGNIKKEELKVKGLAKGNR